MIMEYQQRSTHDCESCSVAKLGATIVRRRRWAAWRLSNIDVIGQGLMPYVALAMALRRIIIAIFKLLSGFVHLPNL